MTDVSFSPYDRWSALPPDTGLYRRDTEKDACGVAMVATMRGHAGHDIIDHALLALANLDHRGATGADPLVAGYARGAEQIGVDDLVATGHRTRSALLRDAARLLAERTGAPSWRAGWAELLVTSGDADLARTGSAVFRELVDDGHAGALTGRQCLLHAHTLLARQNIPRSERRALLAELRGTQDAAAHVTPRADDDWTALARSLIQTLT